MLTVKQVKRFERQPHKQDNRDILHDIIQEHVTGKTPFGLCLAGASAIFEKMIMASYPKGEIHCCETNKEIYNYIKTRMPDGCGISNFDFNEMFWQFDGKFDWVWADYCNNATPDLVSYICDMIQDTNAKVFSFTIDLSSRSVKGGASQLAINLLKYFRLVPSNPRIPDPNTAYDVYSEGNGLEFAHYLTKHPVVDRYYGMPLNYATKFLMGIIAYCIYKDGLKNGSFFIPHTVVYYGGGNNGCVPMATFTYVLSDEYNLEKQNKKWSSSKVFGSDKTRFVDLFQVKKGVTTLEEELEGITMTEKNPTMVKAGQKAWVTRRENEKKRVQSEAGKKAWATRRKNAKKRSANAKKAWATRRANELA